MTATLSGGPSAKLAPAFDPGKAERPRRPGGFWCALGLGSFVVAAVATAWMPQKGWVLLVLPPLVALTLRLRRDAVSLLSIYVVVLLLLPARLVLPNLGGAATPANVVGLAALLVWVLFRFGTNLGLASGRQPMRIVVLLFLWTSALGLAVALSRHIHPIEQRSAIKGMIQAASLCGIALLVADGINGRERLHCLIGRIVGLLSAVALIGILAFATGVDVAYKITPPGLESLRDRDFVFSRSSFRRVAATSEHPIEFGLLCSLGLPLAFHQARFMGRPRRRWWIAVIALAVAVPMSLSRTGVLAVLVGGLILIPSWPPRARWRLLAGTVVWAACMRLVIPGLLGTMRSLVLNAQSDPSTKGRTVDYGIVGEVFEQAPLLGRGLFTFVPSLHIVLDNQWTKTLLEGGIVAVVTLFVLFVAGLSTAGAARRGSRDSSFRDLCQCVKASIAMVMVAFATFDGFSFDMTAGALFLLLGVAGALWRLQRDEEIHPGAVSE